ncbi:Glutamine amidotransferase [Aphelenchoides fujianensis]|nr:Glutamine amidotransferase [Aphelenchoides fujianensis]
MSGGPSTSGTSGGKKGVEPSPLLFAHSGGAERFTRKIQEAVNASKARAMTVAATHVLHTDERRKMEAELRNENSLLLRSFGEVNEKVLILDADGQYGKLVDRRVRECDVYSEMLPLNTPAKEINKRQFRAIIIGGPNSVYACASPKYDPYIFDLGIPILGICYGFQASSPSFIQLINKHFKGSTNAQPFQTDDQRKVAVRTDCALFAGLQPEEQTLLTHGFSVVPSAVASGFSVVGDRDSIAMAIANETKKIYGVQFHPEVDLTTNGKTIFKNILYNIAGLHATYTIEDRQQRCIDHICKVAGNRKVLVMVSGGVDSAVCAELLHRALGKDSVVAIHIDNGRSESHDVVATFGVHEWNVKPFDFSDKFLNSSSLIGDKKPLNQVTDPEEKRMIIGDTFMHCLCEVGEQLKDDTLIALATLRSDLIESSSALPSGGPETIKIQRKKAAIVHEFRKAGLLFEPLKDFHKDEVGKLGRQLSLPETIVNRHPFPSTGLARRIICADRPYFTATFMEITKKVKDAIDIFVRERHAGVEIFSNLLPIRTIGFQGDLRTYSYVVALSTDARPVPWELLDEISRLVPTIDPHINRVVYVYGDPVKPVIRDVTVTHLTADTIKKLRKADNIVTQVLNGWDAQSVRVPNKRSKMHLVQQMPVILIPVQFNEIKDKDADLHSVVLRPFITNDFATNAIVTRVKSEVDSISRVLIDLTSSPPGSIEWE